MKRRDFLKNSATATVASYAAGIGAGFVFQDAHSLPVNGNGNVLINLQLLGGADFRHLFTPAPSTAYGSAFWTARESLYNVDNDPLWTGSDAWNTEYTPVTWGGFRFGIHKNAGWLERQFIAGNVAIICNVKQSENRRHDHAQLVMNSGNPAIENYNYDTSGWGGRIAQSLVNAKVVSMTNRVAIFCKNDNVQNRNSNLISAPNTRDISLSEYPVTDTSNSAYLSRALKAYYAKRGLELSSHALKVVRNEIEARQLGNKIKSILDSSSVPPELSALATGTILSDTNRDYLARQILNIYDSLLVSGEMEFRIASLELDDWDTHRDQKTRIERNFNDLLGTGKALETLSQTVETNLGTEVNDRILYTFTTDFGRQLKSNGTAGTDHGDGNYLILVGPSVRGGVYGTMFPDSEIPRFLDASAAITGLTSFERVLGAVADWMGVADPLAVFPGRLNSPIETNVSLDSLFSKNSSRVLGSIYTNSGVAMEGVVVTITNGSDLTVTTTTTSDGSYLVESLPEGAYSMAATTSGYIIPTSFEYVVASEDLVKNLVASPEPGTISGRITTPDGKGLAGVTLWDANRYPITITTDANGYYIATGYAAGDEVYLNYFSTDYHVVTSGWSSGFFIHDGSAIHSRDFIAIPLDGTRWIGTVTGKVTDSNGIGIAGVSIWDEATYPASLVKTDSRGHYEISGFVANQVVSLQADREGFTVLPDNVVVNFTHNGNAIVGRNFEVTQKQGTILGRVLAVDGRGLSGVTVWDTGKYPTMVTTDANGYYILYDYLIGDTATLNVFKAGYNSTTPSGWDGLSFLHDGSDISGKNYILALV